MDACRQYRISHSHFLGGPPRWTELDQDKAIAHEKLLGTTCGNCGTRPDEWEANPHAYVGHLYRCPGCEVLEQERRNVPEGEIGVHVALITMELSEALEEEERARRAK